jgi:hypothetical protein
VLIAPSLELGNLLTRITGRTTACRKGISACSDDQSARRSTLAVNRQEQQQRFTYTFVIHSCPYEQHSQGRQEEKPPGDADWRHVDHDKHWATGAAQRNHIGRTLIRKKLMLLNFYGGTEIATLCSPGPRIWLIQHDSGSVAGTESCSPQSA